MHEKEDFFRTVMMRGPRLIRYDINLYTDYSSYYFTFIFCGRIPLSLRTVLNQMISVRSAANSTYSKVIKCNGKTHLLVDLRRCMKNEMFLFSKLVKELISFSVL